MFNKEKAAKLLVELKEEAKDLPEVNGFGDDNHKEQYPIIFKYSSFSISWYYNLSIWCCI